MLDKIYEINSLVWAREQDWFNPSAPDISDVPEAQIDEWRALGMDAVWFLGVWRKGEASRRICQTSPDLRGAFERVLPGLSDVDIAGSPFSIAEYRISPELGDARTLPRLREKLNARGLKLILDFVPNHMAVDHPWVQSDPDRFVTGSEVETERAPGNYFRAPGKPDIILAHGRDPYFAGWTDTVQLNYFRAATRKVMIEILEGISDLCDAVRCDMAMLVTNEVFKRTWGDLSFMDYPGKGPREFWEEAIEAVRRRHPDFLFLAEVYWGMEAKLREMGFDFMYDKSLYDMARGGQGGEIRRHIHETQNIQGRLVRFAENHDEARCAEAFDRRCLAVATLVSFLPGPKLYYEGQFEGRRVQLPVQLTKRPNEPLNVELRDFYHLLLKTIANPAIREGAFRPLYVSEAWEGNHTAQQIVTGWRAHDNHHHLMAVNIGKQQAQAYTEIPGEVLGGESVELRDLLGDAVYHRSPLQLKSSGLYLDMAPGTCHIFQVNAIT